MTRSNVRGAMRLATGLFLVAIACVAHAQTDADTVRQLIEVSGVANILRVEAEQAALMADELQPEIPARLRASLRQSIDRTLGFDELEEALVKSAAASLDPQDVDSDLRWWSSASGRAVSRAEVGAYASLSEDSSFEAHNPAVTPVQRPGSAEISAASSAGRSASFFVDLIQSIAAARDCLRATTTLEPRCPHPQQQGSDNGKTAGTVTTVLGAAYAGVSSGDLAAFRAYADTGYQKSAVRILRESLPALLSQRWTLAQTQSAAQISDFAHTMAKADRAKALQAAVADIDEGQNLSRARILLYLLLRSEPQDPAVLVQLARVTLEQAPNMTVYDLDPSVPQLDPVELATAGKWLDEALALDANRAETLMLMGHVAYLQGDFPRSVRLARQARAIGTSSPWLRLNLADALWAMGKQSRVPDRALVREAATEFEAALSAPLPKGAELRVWHQLAPIYAELGDPPRADGFYRRVIAATAGIDQAYALHRYSIFLFITAKDIDGSIAAIRQAMKVADFPLGRDFQVKVLAVKGGLLYTAGRSHEAGAFIAEARQILPDLESICPELAELPVTLPGVFAIRGEGLAKNFSGSVGGLTLVRASRYASASVIEQLLAWGANPNYFDAHDGAPLHAAILGDNAAAVKALLAHGANPLAPFIDGRAPVEMTTGPSDTQRAEILALVSEAAKRRAPAAKPVGTPLRVGYRYQSKRSIVGGNWGNDLPTGTRFTFIGDCSYTDPALACLDIVVPDRSGTIKDIALPKDQLSVWESWFEELGPAQ